MEISLEALRIERIADCDVYVGQGIPTPWKRLFGGQTLAQSVLAACYTVDNEYPIHSLHSYFILAGSSRKEILFNVERTRDGGSFKTRAVKAMQSNKTICLSQCSFHKREFGLSYQVDLQAIVGQSIPPPDITLDKDPTESCSSYVVTQGDSWKLVYMKLDVGAPNNWKVHCSLLTYLSDRGMVDAARRVHKDAQWAMSVSLDHSIHFHRPTEIDVEKWMLFYYRTETSSDARGTGVLQVFDGAKYTLLATVHQESLIRPETKL
eukprot:CAMPEP_0204869234 /NCGR_PEP_ID=MMETSP1348-20121228/28980_1 /ASSEMBLY_ACC=CAM_ASM_000700 /TAXON_ID=215587 /ORGANISM="Aplanochytrium stocchinoi, Strain GSBS06" /LENGTH=263 /DNA_ID=CAMNT_0052022507 /DNA_START=77 /DNA_END=868 /DNA_ORIENTATION=+